jgi:hypothetical protein
MMDQHTVIHQPLDGLAYRDPREIQQLRHLAFARQRVARTHGTALYPSAQHGAQAQVGRDAFIGRAGAPEFIHQGCIHRIYVDTN